MPEKSVNFASRFGTMTMVQITKREWKKKKRLSSPLWSNSREFVSKSKMSTHTNTLLPTLYLVIWSYTRVTCVNAFICEKYRAFVLFRISFFSLDSFLRVDSSLRVFFFFFFCSHLHLIFRQFRYFLMVTKDSTHSILSHAYI